MTAIVTGLKRVIGRSETVLYECRRCGTTVDHDADRCPVCDGEEIACYNL